MIPATETPQAQELHKKLALLPATDLGNAERFFERFQGQFIFSYEENQWYTRTEKGWSKRGVDGDMDAALIATVHAIGEELEAVRGTEADQPASKNWNGAPLLRSELLEKWVLTSQNFPRIRAMKNLARGFFKAPADRLPREGSPPFEGVLGRFLEECTQPDPSSQIQSSVLFQVFQKWCQAHGETAWTANRFGRALRKSGLVSKTSCVIWWLDLAFTEAAEAFMDNTASRGPSHG